LGACSGDHSRSAQAAKPLGRADEVSASKRRRFLTGAGRSRQRASEGQALRDKRSALRSKQRSKPIEVSARRIAQADARPAAVLVDEVHIGRFVAITGNFSNIWPKNRFPGRFETARLPKMHHDLRGLGDRSSVFLLTAETGSEQGSRQRHQAF
jgi:hypothetical protein